VTAGLSVRILAVMLSRLAALVLAGVVTGAPISATACEILCSTRASDEASGDAAVPAHPCHDTESIGTSATMSNQGHVCDHDADLPISFGVTADRSVPHLDFVFVIALPIPSVASVSLAGHAAKLPPDHPRSRVPLRI